MEESIHQIIILCVIVSEILLLHSIVKSLRQQKAEKTTLIFTFFGSLCVVGITALLFTQIGGQYETIFRAGTSFFCLCNMFVLKRVLGDIKSMFSE
jgi:energy-converting hydrogenase Eha subunit A